MSFSNLGLADEILRAVTEQGYTTPTPIQAQAIPAVLAGGDLLAGAQTGTGKTAGFTLPILQRLSTAAAAPRTTTAARPIRALILTPTRELAAQVEESVRTYGKYLKLTSAVIFGGVGINPQIKLLKHGVDILVATPGRLLDHMQQGTVNLNQIEILILDEADRMLDMGFIRDIKRILAVLPKKRQNLLFSATFSDEIKALADGLLNSPAMIEVARRNSTVEIIAQKVHPVDRDRKHPMLAHLIKTNQWSQVLVFTRTKHGANKLVEQLEKDGITGMAIHGNKSQTARTKALVGVQGRQPASAGRHRHRRARHRYRPIAACRQLRLAERAGRLCASHRPHRPRRRHRRSGIAGVRGRASNAARYRKADQARAAEGNHPRLRTRSECARATDPAAQRQCAWPPSARSFRQWQQRQQAGNWRRQRARAGRTAIRRTGQAFRRRQQWQTFCAAPLRWPWPISRGSSSCAMFAHWHR